VPCSWAVGGGAGGSGPRWWFQATTGLGSGCCCSILLAIWVRERGSVFVCWFMC